MFPGTNDLTSSVAESSSGVDKVSLFCSTDHESLLDLMYADYQNVHFAVTVAACLTGVKGG
jgi:hypothetical protein